MNKRYSKGLPTHVNIQPKGQVLPEFNQPQNTIISKTSLASVRKLALSLKICHLGSILYTIFVLYMMFNHGYIKFAGKKFFLIVVTCGHRLLDCIKLQYYRLIGGAKKRGLVSAFSLWVPLAIVCFCIACLLRGSFSDVEGTFVFSGMLSSLILLPAYLYAFQGGNFYQALLGYENLSLHLYETELPIARLAVLGAWSGAVVAPLDWERPWQVWPIPCVVGSLIGFAVGNLLAIYELGRYVRKYEEQAEDTIQAADI